MKSEVSNVKGEVRVYQLSAFENATREVQRDVSEASLNLANKQQSKRANKRAQPKESEQTNTTTRKHTSRAND